jgi:AraC-like DNA-binding protein
MPQGSWLPGLASRCAWRLICLKRDRSKLVATLQRVQPPWRITVNFAATILFSSTSTMDPQLVGPFRRCFQAPLVFDAGRYAVVFTADWLNRALPDSDPEASRLLQKQIDALEAKHGDDFPEQVRDLLRTALLTGHGSAEQVAAFFSVRSRTLNRRLNAFGTSFQELRDEGCFGIAREMLDLSRLEIAQIATALDYADASAFTRAFRRWSGTTPARWRVDRKARSRPTK